MKKQDFYEELVNKMGMDLESDTLYYQLNMFIDACNMDIKSNGSYTLFSGIDSDFYIKDYEDEELNYHFEFTKNRAYKNNMFTFKGNYNDLIFAFHVYYKNDKIGNNIYELPFSLFLKQRVDNKTYLFHMDTLNNSKTQFSLEEKKVISNEELFDHVCFYSKRIDLENVFEAVKAFVENPENVYQTYKHLMEDKVVYYDRNEIDSVNKNDLLVTKQGKLLEKVKK